MRGNVLNIPIEQSFFQNPSFADPAVLHSFFRLQPAVPGCLKKRLKLEQPQSENLQTQSPSMAEGSRRDLLVEGRAGASWSKAPSGDRRA